MGNAKFEAAIAAMNAQRERAGINIDGKLYSRVKDRVELFRKEWGDEFGIDTNVMTEHGFEQGAPVIAVAKVTKDGHVLASGWAVEFIGSNDYTTTSPIEVAETSAIGRALACFGLHGGEYASDNEVAAKGGGKWHGEIKGNGPAGDPHFIPTEGVSHETQTGNDPSGFYVPSEHDEMWARGPEAFQGRILQEIDRIQSRDELAAYWHNLKPFMNRLAQSNAVDLAAEIKAAFATMNAEMTGGR